MSVKEIITDSVKRELESYVRYSLLLLASVVTFFLYIVEREHQANGDWQPDALPKISVFGLQFEHEQLVYAIFLIPILQLVLLRPLQGILDLLVDLESDFDECKSLLSRSPSVFNPYHFIHDLRHGAAYWLSLIVISSITVFFPSVILVIWLTEVLDGDFVFSTTIFGIIVLTFLFLQVEVMSKTWDILFGRKNMYIRMAILFISFIGVGYGVFASAT
jgi:hypothetical protein